MHSINMQGPLKLDLKIQANLDNSLSNCEHKVFYDPASKKADVAYRGTDMHDPDQIWSDFKSDFSIMLRNVNADTLWIQPGITRMVLWQHM